MERRQDDSSAVINFTSLPIDPITSTASPTSTATTTSHTSSAAIADSPSSSWPSMNTSTLVSTAVSSADNSTSTSSGNADAAFLMSKGAVAGVFTGLGILMLLIFAIIYFGLRRVRQHRAERKSMDARSNQFETFGRMANQYPGYGDPQTHRFSVHSASKPRSRPVSMSSLSKWARQKSGRQTSQSRNSTYVSPVDDEMKGYGKEGPWSLAKVVEDQQQHALSPYSRTKRPEASYGGSKERKTVREDGANFTLEDALLPSLTSSPISYQAGARGGRHPYAQM